jgi:hypothetical protein
LTENLLSLLRDPELVPATVDISINQDGFMKEMMDGSMKYLVMTEYQKVIDGDMLANTLRPAPEDRIPEMFMRVLTSASLQADRTTFYFPDASLSHDFEQMLFCENFPFCSDLSSILDNFRNEDRQALPKRIIEVYLQMAQYLEISEPVIASCCVLLMFRIMFSQAYARDPAFFYKNGRSDLQELGKKVPIEELGVDDAFLPEHDALCSVSDVFGKEELTQKASLHLEFALLMTNPIDAIYEIHEMIIYLEKAAMKHGSQGMVPFELGMGLFIGTLLSSAIPNFEELAEFVYDFGPMSGMCPEFEFTRTTVRAAYDHVRTLRAKYS